jgi:hypothetical protein
MPVWKLDQLQVPAAARMLANDAGCIAFYPSMGMMRVCKDLLPIGEGLFKKSGLHKIQALLGCSQGAGSTGHRFEIWTMLTKQEVARNIYVKFVDERGKLWMFHGFIGTTSAQRADGRRVFVKPQLLRIQRAVRRFIQHRRWLRQARRVFTRCMKNSRLTPDLVQLICREVVK